MKKISFFKKTKDYWNKAILKQHILFLNRRHLYYINHLIFLIKKFCFFFLNGIIHWPCIQNLFNFLHLFAWKWKINCFNLILSKRSKLLTFSLAPLILKFYYLNSQRVLVTHACLWYLFRKPLKVYFLSPENSTCFLLVNDFDCNLLRKIIKWVK